MKKYALYTYPGRESERGWPQLGGEEMDETCVRLSDWYCHADEVRVALEAKDREIAKLRAKYIAVVDRYDHAADMVTSLYDRIHEKDAMLKAITASSSPEGDEGG